MSYYCINKKRIVKLNLSQGYDKNLIQIGVPNTDGRAEKVGLKSVGDSVLPAADFGTNSKKNAYGYSYADKTQPKKNRYVSTVWIHPYGNERAASVSCDIYKECYPKIEVPPTEIELFLFNDKQGETYIMVNLTSDIRAHHLKEAINLLLEIFGECYIFCDEIKIDNQIKNCKCNWVILPPGEKFGVDLSKQLKKKGKNTDTFDVNRLNTLDKYNVEQKVEGVNGFTGYYAYVFQNHCILESAVYGNATYIIPKKNWEIYSQMTKKELLDDKLVIEKLVHNEKWTESIIKSIKKLENQ